MLKGTYFLFLYVRLVLSTVNGEEPILEATLTALRRNLDFNLYNIDEDNNSLNADGLFGINMAQDDYKSMNADGIFGISQAEAHLHKTLDRTNDSQTLKKLSQLLGKAKAIYALQGPNLKNFPYKYYVFNKFVIPPENWERDIDYSYGKLNYNPKVYTGPYNVENALDYVRYVTNNTFAESQSDDCLVEAATATDNVVPHDCPISNTCVDNMLTIPSEYSMKFPGYGVTHMLLFLQIARNRNCNINYENFNKTVNEECSYILWELRKNAQHGYFSNLEDLLLEQIALCGLEGFGEFLTKEYLEYVLTIQHSKGGYQIKLLTKEQILNGKRHKREAGPMKYGCNNHSTGLGATVLALYIRLLIEKPFSNSAFYKNQQ